MRTERCPNCGAPVPTGNLVCSVCNAPLNEAEPDASRGTDTRSPVIKAIERLTVVFAVIAVLSPFWAVLAPLVLMRLNGTAEISDIHVRDAWVRPISMPMPGHTMEGVANNTAAYLTIENKGSVSDRLTSVTTDAATTVEIHQTQIDDQGVARMQLQPDGIAIPANTTVMIEPGSYHIMLSEMQKSLETGETISLMLTFASGKIEQVEAIISDEPPEQSDD